MNQAKPYAGTQSVVRALRLLKLFHGATPEISFAELRERSGLNRSTAFRLLTALESEGLIEKNATSDGYRLGPQIAALGRRAVADGDLCELARREMEALSVRTNETVTLEVLAEADVKIVAEARGDHVLGSAPSVGTTWPAHATSTGKVLWAAASEEDRERFLSRRLAAMTANTRTTRKQLEIELETARVRGFAVSIEELEPGYVAVAVPVFDARGTVIAALSVGGPVQRLSPAQLSSVALDLGVAARAIRRELGG